jgi:hypothetical protein
LEEVHLQKLAVTESWNGTNWTEVNDLNTARAGLGGAGADNTSALAFGGDTPLDTGNTESWNGTNWTEVNDLNTARQYLAGVQGQQLAALAFGRISSPGTANQVITELLEWNKLDRSCMI